MISKDHRFQRLSDLYTWNLVERVASLGSMNKAAEELQLDVSSVSNKVKQLEKALGYELFERLAHSCVLTSKGELALKSLSPILIDFSNTMLKVADEERSSHDQLKINVANGLLPLMVEFLGEFKESHYPNAEIVLTDNKSQDLGHQLGFNVAIFANFGQRPPGHCTDLGIIPTIMVAATEYLRKHPLDCPQDLIHHTLISCYNWNCGQRMLYRSDGQAIALNWENLFGVDTNQTALCAVRREIGIGWGIPLHLCEEGLMDGSLTRIFPDCESAALHFFLAVNSAPLTQITSDFVLFVRKKWQERFREMPAFAPCYALR